MNWDALGAIAELAGAIGVIGSLIYLGTQIRNQNRESQLAAANELAAQWNAAMSDVATNGDLAKIITTGMDDVSQLEPHEYAQFGAHMNRWFRSVESLYAQHEADRLETELWDGISTSVIHIARSPGVRVWWASRNGWYGQSFSNYIEHCISSEKGIAISYSEHRRSVEATETPPDKSLEPNA